MQCVVGQRPCDHHLRLTIKPMWAPSMWKWTPPGEPPSSAGAGGCVSCRFTMLLSLTSKVLPTLVPIIFIAMLCGPVALVLCVKSAHPVRKHRTHGGVVEMPLSAACSVWVTLILRVIHVLSFLFYLHAFPGMVASFLFCLVRHW